MDGGALKTPRQPSSKGPGPRRPLKCISDEHAEIVTMRGRAVYVLAVTVAAFSPAAGQQLPALDPAIQLGVCQAQRSRFLSDSEQAQAYATQFMAEIADLKKKLAEAEAKLPKTEPRSETQP